MFAPFKPVQCGVGDAGFLDPRKGLFNFSVVWLRR